MREQGFYWVRRHLTTDPEPCRWDSLMEWWQFCGSDIPYMNEDLIDIGPRVQRDSEVVRQRDELIDQRNQLVGLFAAIKHWVPDTSVTHKMFDDLVQKIARIESAKSGSPTQSGEVEP